MRKPSHLETFDRSATSTTITPLSGISSSVASQPQRPARVHDPGRCGIDRGSANPCKFIESLGSTLPGRSSANNACSNIQQLQLCLCMSTPLHVIRYDIWVASGLVRPRRSISQGDEGHVNGAYIRGSDAELNSNRHPKYSSPCVDITISYPCYLGFLRSPLKIRVPSARLPSMSPAFLQFSTQMVCLAIKQPTLRA